MAEIIDFKVAQIREQLRSSINAENLKSLNESQSPELPTSGGHFLYIAYRQERTQQGWPEPKWDSLSQSQKLVWLRMSERLGLRQR